MSDPQIEYALYEHAVGYSLFKITSWEEIGMGVESVADAVNKVDVFSRLVKLLAFQPFNDAESALANANALSEGLLHADLETFLANNFPGAEKKKKKHMMAVGEKNIASQISEKFPGIGCVYSNPAPQYLRGIRIHFEKLVGKLSTHAIEKSQLSLGHSYSRSKVKFNVHRVDNMIIQSIALLDQLDKDINTFTMRLREWYSYHFPELIKLVPEATKYSRCVFIIKDRTKLVDDTAAQEQLKELLLDDTLVETIVEAARTSMGMDISEIDLINVEAFAARVSSLVQFRTELQEYLRGRMSDCAPNLAALVGEQVGARLISHAGSLTNLAKYPASTVQILGAEKALFRALKTRGNTPKYGLLFHSTFIGRAGAKNKGRISRYLANKCSIASRIDCFAETPVSTYGEHLRQQVEDRLTYYETGKKPAKNLEVMHAAAGEAVEATEKAKKKARKRAKKEKKAQVEIEDPNDVTADSTIASEPSPKKKKQSTEAMETEEAPVSEKKKKKKSKGAEQEEEMEVAEQEEDQGTEKKKKKKKKKSMAEQEE